MWATLLQGFLGQGTQPPQPLPPDSEEQTATIALYVFAAIVLAVVVYAFVQLSKK